MLTHLLLVKKNPYLKDTNYPKMEFMDSIIYFLLLSTT